MSRYDTFAGLAGAEPGVFMTNPLRGCGRKVPGGSYLEGAVSPVGLLARMTWVLGDHCDSFRNPQGRLPVNLFCDVPRRAMMFFNPAATLATGQVILGQELNSDDLLVRQRYACLKDKVGTVGLLDYVGDKFYSPWSFATEVMTLGPSRRVTKGFMKQVAPMLPLPVFFAHKNIPTFSTDQIGVRALQVACDLTGRRGDFWGADPTWYKGTWGLGQEDSSGDDHFMLPILKAYSEWDSEMEDRSWSNSVHFDETIFMASWFTRGTYVLESDDAPGVELNNIVNLPPSLLEHGDDSDDVVTAIAEVLAEG